MISKAVSDSAQMITRMAPVLDPQDYCFCHVADDHKFRAASVLATFREDEGLTLVLPLAQAQAAGLTGPPFRRITLQVHSALEGVGLTAAVAGALAEGGIACNVMAAFYHDHIFVPSAQASDALSILQRLSAAARR